MINTDLAPTFLDYAGAPWDVDGRSWRALLDGTGASSWRRRVLTEHWTDPNSPYPFGEMPDMAVVRTSSSDSAPDQSYVGYHGLTGKLAPASPATENEQYDDVADPGQLVSVVNDGVYAAARADLAPKLQALRQCAGATCRTAED